MSEVDLAIGALVLLMAVLGFFQGFIVSAFSLIGLAVGGFAATRLSQEWFDQGASSPYAPLVGLAGALALAAMGGSALQDVGVWLRSRMHMREGVAVDRLFGALLSGAIGLGLAWIVATTLMSLPQLRQVRPFITDSRVIAQMNHVLPPAQVLNVLARYDPFPAFDGPRITIGAPDARLPADPQVRAAADSVLRVIGSACGFSLTGSAWVAAPEVVVTNAHVVAGVDRPSVVERDGTTHAARIVGFDTVQDLAVLEVPGLDARPLPMVAGEPRSGTAGAVLGFPENGPFTTSAARYSDTRAVRSDDIYGRGGFDRRVTSFRGEVRHGNSGGPLVDGDGRVVTTVFASTVGGDVTGGYGVPNDVTQRILAATDGPVPSGPCTR